MRLSMIWSRLRLVVFGKGSRCSGDRKASNWLVGALSGVGVLQSGGAGLQQGLEVGDDLRPAAGDRRDEFRGFALYGVGDGALARPSTGFLHGRCSSTTLWSRATMTNDPATSPTATVAPAGPLQATPPSRS